MVVLAFVGAKNRFLLVKKRKQKYFPIDDECYSGKKLVISPKMFFGPWLGYVTQNNLLLKPRTKVFIITANGMLVNW